MQQLLALQHHLADMLAVARESVALCEQALELIDAAQLNSTNGLSSAAQCWRRQANQPCPAADRPSHTERPNCSLTTREIEVLRLIAQGDSNRQIADTLFLSARTVERHIANIYLKIDVHSKADAAAFACHHGLV